jgi:hypothetical protein
MSAPETIQVTPYVIKGKDPVIVRRVDAYSSVVTMGKWLEEWHESFDEAYEAAERQARAEMTLLQVSRGI